MGLVGMIEWMMIDKETHKSFEIFQGAAASAELGGIALRKCAAWCRSRGPPADTMRDLDC